MMTLKKIPPIIIVLFLLIIAFTQNELYGRQDTYGDTLCSITIDQGDTEICAGDCVDLSAIGECPNNLMLNDFEDGTLGPGWAANCSPMFNTPCGIPPYQSNIYAWIGDASSFPRILVTETYTVSDECEICFDLKFAYQGANTPCEGPDEMDEGVALQYSSDGGATWHDIIYFCPDGNFYSTIQPDANGPGGTTQFTSWDNYCFDVPAGAMGPNTRFRWYQQQVTNNECDHWGIDNVLITCPTPDAEVAWYEGTNTTPFDDTFDPPLVCPSVTTDYTVEIEDPSEPSTAASDQITITVYPDPGLSIDGLDAFYCTNDAPVTLVGSPSGGTFSGTGVSAGQFDPNAAGPGGPYTITYNWDQYNAIGTTVLCSYSTTTTVSVYNYPTISVGSDAPICTGEDLHLGEAGGEAVSWSWSGPDGFSSTEQYPTINGATIDAAGTYTVEITNANGCTNSADVDVTINLTPALTLGSNSPICAGEDLNLTESGGDADNWSWTGPSSFSSSAQNPTISSATTAASGTYTVVVNDVNGCSNTASISVTVNPVPYVISGSSSPVCEGEDLNLTESAGDATSWSWSGPLGFTSSEQNPTITDVPLAAEGFYTVIATSSEGCTGTDSVSVTVNPTPTVDVGPDQTICDYEAPVTLDAGPGFNGYTWNTTESTQTIDVSVTDIYSITVTDNNGCTGSDNMLLTVNPSPNPDLGGDQNICDYDTVSVTLDAGPGDFYQWNISENSQIITVNETGTYAVTVTNNFGCSGTDSMDLIIDLLPDPDLGPDTVLCDYDAPILLDPSTDPSFAYQWSDNSSGDVLQVSETGIYSVTVTEGICSAEDEIQVTVNPSPSVDLGADQWLCETEAPYVLDAGSGLAAYEWSTGNVSQTLNVIETDTFAVTVTNEHGCIATDEVYIHIDTMPDSEILYDTHYCIDHGVFYLEAGSDGGTWEGAGIADNNTGLFVPEIVGDGETQITYTVENGECTSVSEANIHVHALPDIQVINVKDVRCYGDATGEIQVAAPGSTSPQFAWVSHDISGSHIKNLTAGVYNLQVTDTYGCLSDTFLVVSQPSELLVDYESGHPSCIGYNDGYVELMVTGGVEPYLYCWDMGESYTPSFARLYEGEYNFVIKDNNGCKESVSVKLVDTPIECIRIPNAFTPNGDDTNDTWIIENLEIYNNYLIKVFNRWGQLVYVAETGDEPWDGTTMKGKKVPAGSYVYVIKLDSGREQKSGTVTVVY
ncbi:MAG: gliding motility-associated C-terminal domain-containing protein [Bacteroidota bacterium]|nr:gliding motility-associated C-terminal domain-containing protein [Bacteroidota bacterium]